MRTEKLRLPSRRKAWPRSYAVVYRDGRQRQIYVPRDQLPLIRKGLGQHQRALALLQQITDINMKLMRDGLLEESLELEKEEEQP